MANSPLHGLNIVHDDSYPSRDNNDLLSAPHIQAHLDAWTNLTFQTDDSSLKEDRDQFAGGGLSSSDSPSIVDDKDDDQEPVGPANPDSHANVVNAISIPQPGQSTQLQHNRSEFDVNAVLSDFGINPFLVPHLQGSQHPQSQSASLAQLLQSYPFALQQQNLFGQQVPHVSSQFQQSGESEAGIAGAGKKARRKSTAGSPILTPVASSSSASLAPDSPVTGLSPAEDKRRRNTAASARFRAKKKEREVALERRSKDLEGRVTELERECEKLLCENNWLRGLVMGATGANPGSGGTIVPSLAPSSTSGKRKREEEAKA